MPDYIYRFDGRVSLYAYWPVGSPQDLETANETVATHEMGFLSVPTGVHVDTVNRWWRELTPTQRQGCVTGMQPPWPGSRWIGKALAIRNTNNFRSVISEVEYCCAVCARAAGHREVFITASGNLPHHMADAFQSSTETATQLMDRLSGTIPPTVTSIHECGKCGFPGHNTRTCSLDKSYDKVGIEIEGRWINLDAAYVKSRDYNMGRTEDCSIRSSPTGRASRMEFQTKPGTLGFALKQLVALYPDEADHSTGMHVHVSFLDTTHITQLMCQPFYDFFHQRWQQWADAKGLHKWHHLRARLEGRNDYCHKNVADTRDPFNCDRYQQLNFTAWNEHRTVECRLLPMFHEGDLAVEAVVYLLKIFEDWLASDAAQLALPVHSMIAVENEVEACVHNETMELVEDTYEHREEHSLEITELPPVAEGVIRMVIGRNQMIALQDYFPEIAQRLVA